MCTSVWPGLDSEGLLYFKDLTNPPVFLETLSTPYGTAGAVFPLGLVLLYSRALGSSLAGEDPCVTAWLCCFLSCSQR